MISSAIITTKSTGQKSNPATSQTLHIKKTTLFHESHIVGQYVSSMATHTTVLYYVFFYLV